MKKMSKNGFMQFCRLILVLLILTSSANLYAQDNTNKTGDKSTNQNSDEEKPPTLADIIPQAALLNDKLSTLNNSMDDLVDVKSIDENYKDISTELKNITTEFNKFNKEGRGRIATSELDNLKGELNKSGQKFDDSNKALKDAIEVLEKSRKEWLTYKSKWSNYEKQLTNEDLPTEAKRALKSADGTIEKGINVIGSKLNVLLKLQQKGYTNQSIINDLNTKIGILKQKKIASAFEDGSIPMYSPKFYEQFNSKMWPDIKRGFKNVILPGKSFFENNWWIFLFQIFVTLLVVYLIRKNADFLRNSTSYEYFGERAISAGIFFGFLFPLIFHGDMKSTPLWNLMAFTAGGIAFCRLISNRQVPAWKNNFYYALVIALILTGVFHVFNFPIVLFRIFIVIVSAAGIYKLFYWFKKNKETVNAKGYKWLFLGLFLYLWVIVISEIIGKEVLALYMYESLLKTFMLIVFTVVFLSMIEAGIEIGLKMISNSNDDENDNVDDDSNSVLLAQTVNGFSRFISILVFLLAVFPRVLVFWNIYTDVPEAYNKLIGIGFSIGSNFISLGALIASVCILYGCYIFSTLFEMLLMNDRIERKLDKGARMSIAQLIKYFVMFFGFLVAIASLGYDLTNFTIVLSALGVGIGFGLQGVVNNFVSGLILLFERPIREGDTVEVDGTWSDVKKIGLRSTRVQTFDQSEVIIPNADLVYNKVTNWTLNNHRKRITVPVGVAYGSDINLVMELLKEIGTSVDGIVKNVKPTVLFRDFGDSTLNFELRVRAREALEAINVESDVRVLIDNKFRENNIEIAFPQRDLHIRSIDEEVLVDFNKEHNKTDEKLKKIQLTEDKNIEKIDKPVKRSTAKSKLKTATATKEPATKEPVKKVAVKKEVVKKPTVKKTVPSKTSKPKTTTTKTSESKGTKPVTKKPKED